MIDKIEMSDAAAQAAMDWNGLPFTVMYEVPSKGSPIVAFKSTGTRLAAKTADGRWHIVPLPAKERAL